MFFSFPGVNSSSIYRKPSYAKLFSLFLMDRCPVSFATLAVLCIISTRRNRNRAHYRKWVLSQRRQCFLLSTRSLPHILEMHLLLFPKQHRMAVLFCQCPGFKCSLTSRNSGFHLFALHTRCIPLLFVHQQFSVDTCV